MRKNKKEDMQGYLHRLVKLQLESFFPKEQSVEFFSHDKGIPQSLIDSAFKKTENCLAPNIIKTTGLAPPPSVFRPRHTSHYCIFLYYLSTECLRARNLSSSRVYALNKALHAVDIYYEINLPDVFYCEHPVGSVMGRAQYGERFYFSQGCTVGSNNRIYPVIGNGVSMCAGAMIIGDSQIGDGAILSAGSLVVDQNVPENVIVFGRSPDLTFKPIKEKTRAQFSFFTPLTKD